MTQQDDDEDAFLEQFIRKPGKPLPDWAIKDLNNIYDELKDLPFFMKELPQNPENHPELAAFQSMLYEGTPEEIGCNFKNQGNEAFSQRSFSDSLVFYGKGLEISGISTELKATLFLNRSAAHIEMQNYMAAVFDSLEALKLDNSLIKGYYRCAKALLLLGRAKSAAKYCKEGLALQPSNSLLIDLEGKIAQECVNLKNENSLSQEISQALEKRGIKNVDSSDWICSQVTTTNGSCKDKQLQIPQISLSLNENGKLVLPVVFLYPPYGESDFIADCSEECSILELLEMVFSQAASWDSQFLYVKPYALKTFYEWHESGMPLGNKICPFESGNSISWLLKSRNFVLLDGICHVIVVPEGWSFSSQGQSQYCVVAGE